MTTRNHPHCDCGPLAICTKCAPTPMSKAEAKADAERHIKGITVVPLTPDEEQYMDDPLADWERELMAEQTAATYDERGDVVPDLVEQLADEIASAVYHPAHYGGGDNPYEAIKVIEAWNLGFCLGNTVKYISRAGKKGSDAELQDLMKARWYLDRRISQIQTGAEAGYGG